MRGSAFEDLVTCAFSAHSFLDFVHHTDERRDGHSKERSANIMLAERKQAGFLLCLLSDVIR
jgi:hypothetical protein